MGRERRERPADGRDRLGAGGGGLGRVENAGGDGAGQHAVAGGAGGRRVAVGAAGFRRLRQRDEERRLGRSQAARLLAEPGEGSGADALEVAAVGGERQVELEDRVLVEPALQRQRHADLAELAPDGAGRAVLEQARDLHGQRRAARHDVAGGEGLRGGAGEGQRVDAGVAAEAAVLEGGELGEVARVDGVERDRQPPAAVGDRVGVEKGAAAVEDDGRGRRVERRQQCCGDPAVERQPEANEGEGSGEERGSHADVAGTGAEG